MDLLPSLPSPLIGQLRSRTTELLPKIVKANLNTQFAQTASQLAKFRHAMDGFVDRMNTHILSEAFHTMVQFTSYDAYAPLTARLFERPCRASAITDLFAPGLPDVLLESSSTSGSLPKAFPKYGYMSTIKSSDVGSREISDTSRRRTKASLSYFEWSQISVEDEENRPMATICYTSGSAIGLRMYYRLDPEKDAERMGTFIHDHAAPFAAGFIKKWRSFLLIHALFAVGSRSLKEITAGFIVTFVDMTHYLNTEFDMIVECIESGTIPDLDGISEVRHHLEANISPDPERAEELRRLGRPSTVPGWCARVWPNLRSLACIASGSFASYIPLAKWFLGPNVTISPLLYGSTEAMIGFPHDPLEPNQYKLTFDSNLIELLDIEKDDSIDALAQLWEVEKGKKYEPVLTTPHGLWRYRLGDVIQVAGFDPKDGVPVIQYIERRNTVLRFPDVMVTEQDLKTAVLSVVPDTLGRVVDWTTTVDDRQVPATIAFFVELDGDHASNIALAPERMFAELCRSNSNIDWAVGHDKFRKPTVRLVRPGTFSDFRQLKLDEGSKNLGQIKVPVVLPKDTYIMWMLDRVVQEL